MLFKKPHFFGYLWSRMGSFQSRIWYLKSTTKLLSFCLQKIWFRSFKRGTTRLPMSIHILNHQKLLRSLGLFQLVRVRPGFHSWSGRTLRACNFAVLWPARLYSISIERYDSYMFGNFKDTLCYVKKNLFYFMVNGQKQSNLSHGSIWFVQTWCARRCMQNKYRTFSCLFSYLLD